MPNDYYWLTELTKRLQNVAQQYAPLRIDHPNEIPDLIYDKLYEVITELEIYTDGIRSEFKGHYFD